MLEALASTADHNWTRLAEEFGLVPHADRKPDDPPVLPDLRQFIRDHHSSMPLVSKLI